MTTPTAKTNPSAPFTPGLPPGLTSNFVIGLAILLGGALRIVFVLRADFPYNDGGLFYMLVNELVANSFRLPAFSAYNSTHLPVVYPPLAFYLAGLINSLFGVSVIQIQRWLPLIFSLLTIPVFAWLSRAILKNPAAAALATLAFALLPNSTDRLLMGGGLTRAPSFFFALVALTWIYRLFENGYDNRHRRELWLAILFSALTVLSHPVYAWFVAYSSGVFLIFAERVNRFDTVRGCLQTIQVDCLAKWSTDQQTTFDYLFVPKIPLVPGQSELLTTPLVQALRLSPDYQLVSDQDGALIFKTNHSN